MESQVDRLKLINQVSVIGCLFDVDVQDVVCWGGFMQDLTKGGSDKHPPKVVAPRGVLEHAPPEHF